MSAPASAAFDGAAPDSPSALARFALNLPEPVDGDLPGGRWCQECGIRTNHTSAMHEDAARDAPEEY